MKLLAGLLFTLCALFLSEKAFAQDYEFNVNFTLIKVIGGNIYEYSDSKSEFLTHPFPIGRCAKTNIFKKDGTYNLIVACTDGINYDRAWVQCDPMIVGSSDIEYITNKEHSEGFIAKCETTRKVVESNQWGFDLEFNPKVRKVVLEFIASVLVNIESSRSVDI